MEKLEAAVASYERAIEIGPRGALPHGNMGLALWSMSKILSSSGRYAAAMDKLEAAVASYERAIEIDPRGASHHCNMGGALRSMSEILSSSGRYAAAMEKLEAAVASHERAIEINPRGALHHGNMGNALDSMSEILSSSGRYAAAMEKLEAAVASYERAIEINPRGALHHGNMANALYSMSEILSSSGRYAAAMEKLETAVASHERAIEIDPRGASHHGNMGVALCSMSEILSSSGRHAEAMEKLEAAVASYERAIEINPRDARHHNNKALVLFKRGRILLAEKAPAAPDCFADALQSYLAAARLQPTPRLLQKAEEKFHTIFSLLQDYDLVFHEAVARILRTGLNIMELRGSLDPALNQAAALNLAIYFREADRPRLAFVQVQESMRDPSLAPAAAALGAQILIEDLKRPSEAVRLAFDFLTRNPVDMDFLDDYLLLVLECAGCLSGLAETERFLPLVLQLMERIEPDPERESAFCDLVDAVGAALRIEEFSGDDRDALARYDELRAKADRRVYERIGAWRQHGFFDDPDDDIGEDYLNMTLEDARDIRKSQKKWASDGVMSYLKGLGEIMMDCLADQSRPLPERLVDAYETFRGRFMVDAEEADRQIAEDAYQFLQRLFLVLLPVQLATEKICVKPATVPGAEASTRNLVAASAMLLEQCAGPGLNYGLAVIPLAIALEEEFRAKMLKPLKRAAETGVLGPLNFLDAFCEIDHVCDRYRVFLKDGEERFAFGHLTGTWEMLSGVRKNAPELLQAVVAWFGVILETTPLPDKAVHGALWKIGALRNRAAHPGKPPVEEREAREAYAICMEALSESRPFALIPEFAQVKTGIQMF